MIIFTESPPVELNFETALEPTLSQIHLITQYFVPTQAKRQHEINYCLQQNIQNSYIDRIHLLNEQVYSFQNNSTSSKIVQKNIGKRLTMKHVLEYIREANIEGFVIVSNADIFFDSGLKKLKHTNLSSRKQLFALLRWEYSQGAALETCPLFGPRPDSQDTWVFHTSIIKQYIDLHKEKSLDITFGKLGCDNKIAYIFTILGFEVINDPQFLRTYHYHVSNLRTYTTQDRYPPPYVNVFPARIDIEYQLKNALKNISISLNYLKFEEGNTTLRNYITTKFEKNERFLIPRIAGIENNIAFLGELYKLNGNQLSPSQMNYINSAVPKMKTNAGVYIPNIDSLVQYSQMYLKAFENCEIYAAWETWGAYIKHISSSHDFISQKYHIKHSIWAFTYDIFHHIYKDPFTNAFRGKRILIISMFEKSIREQVEKRQALYDGVDLFPECEFLFIKPPITNGATKSRDFMEELASFYQQLDEFKGKYDVALLSCGGYGNLIANYIYENHQSSAIYVGGVLQMWFGVYGHRWLVERPDALKLFMNEHWKRPYLDERPEGCENIEKGCYW